MKVRNRITTPRAVLLYIMAGTLDVIGLVLGFFGINFIASFVAFVILTFLFSIFGASYVKKPARLIRAVAIMIFGAIPIVGALPVEQIVGVFLNIRDIKKEDRLFNAKQQAMIEEQAEQDFRIQRALWLREQRGLNIN